MVHPYAQTNDKHLVMVYSVTDKLIPLVDVNAILLP